MNQEHDANKVRNRSNILKGKQALLTGAITFMSFFPSGIVAAQNAANEKQNDQNEQVQEKDGVKYFIDQVEVGSISEIDVGQRHNAVYNELIDAVIFTQYSMKNPTKSDQAHLDFVNNDILSPGTEGHELLHREFLPVSTGMYDGSVITTTSDRTRARIFEEVCCLKKQKGFASIVDAIDDFRANKKHETYARHYSSNSGNILVALAAEEKVPDQVFKGFEREVSGTKIVNIGDKDYFASLYISQDKKYKTYCLHDENDNVVSSPEIIKQSSFALGQVTTISGKPVLMPDGKQATASFYRDATNAYGGYAGYSEFKVDNFTGETQGYTHKLAKENINKVYSEYAKIAGLNSQELKALTQFVEGIELNNDLSNEQIKEIKETYKGSSLEAEQQKRKTNYASEMAAAKDEFVKTALPHLKQTQSPIKMVSQNDAKSLNTTAFYTSAKTKAGR